MFVNYVIKYTCLQALSSQYVMQLLCSIVAARRREMPKPWRVTGSVWSWTLSCGQLL